MDHVTAGREELLRRLKDIPESDAWRAAQEAAERRRRIEAAYSRIRKAGLPSGTQRRWGWALEPLAACPRASATKRARQRLALGDLSLAHAVTALARRFGNDWDAAARLLDGVHEDVSKRLIALAALEDQREVA